MRTKKNSISVIIPTRKRLKLLKNALRSVINQSTLPEQIIVIDDASENKVKRYINILKSKYRKINFEYVQRKNYYEGSSPASINLGFKYCSSEYLAIIDDDDTWHKNYLDACIKRMTNSSSKLIVSPLLHVKNKKIKIGKKIPIKFKLQDWLTFNPGLICSNIFINRNVFKKLNLLDGKLIYSADRDLMIRFSLSNYKYSILNKPMVFYNIDNHPSKSKKFIRYLKSNLRFYKKYFFLMNLSSHFVNLRKLLTFSLIYLFNYMR